MVVDVTMSKKCMQCEDELSPFEREVCGPCRLQDPKFKDESEDEI